MLELADRSEAGILTAEELAEYDSYLRVGNFLAAMRSTARLARERSLARKKPSFEQ
jgi:hypothetical protein